MTYYLAVDIGASSGRHILGCVQDGRIELEEVYRFDNQLEEKDGTLCWDAEGLFAHIKAGMKECARLGKIPITMGLDTWGVDFALLDGRDRRLGACVAYRDHRTDGMDAAVDAIIPYPELYARTGIHRNIFNTIYQLMALKRKEPTLLSEAESLLFTPDYHHFRLTGVKKQEYTMASTSGLLNAKTRDWDTDIIDKLGLPKKLFGPIAMPGSTVGRLLPEVEKEVGFGCAVVLPASHDTGSAYMAVPAKSAGSVYLSSGTWSLLGLEIDTPILTDKARDSAFTNEGGYTGSIRFLQNIMGLWMIQSIRREYDKKYSYAEMEAMAREATDFTSQVDVNDQRFLSPKSMKTAIRAYCMETNQPVPSSLGQMVQCVYVSLAACYARAIENLREITQKSFDAIHIVGGGSKDVYLNQLTADATGLPVHAGPIEGTVIGNLMAQMIADGAFSNLADARAAVARSFPLATFEPRRP
ncbi:rhamnulokinase [Ruminococcaceae bacterium OttesenSCG-928-D13]|nr:rhamnulokinase [Ruminococcaceae bacterium OttesenSCG-928-D13]